MSMARVPTSQVEELVNRGAALDYKDKKGLTALHYAAGEALPPCPALRSSSLYWA